MNNLRNCKGVQTVFRKCVTSTLLLASVSLLSLAGSASGDPLSGAIFTTDAGCNKVNGNIYDTKEDVHLNGGPAKTGAAGLPEGDYYVQVTDPTGATVLGTSGSGTPIHVNANGEFAQCYELCLIAPASGGGCFDNTPNNGGEYKVWVSTISTFDNDSTKTDNFKVRASATCDKAVCISCPVNLEVPCSLVNGQNVKVDYDPPIVIPDDATVECVPPSGSDFPAGQTTTVTCTATKGADSDSCHFDVTVDTCPSCTLTCPLDQNPCNDSGLCSAVATYLTPSCEADVVVTCDPASGSAFPVGPNVVTCTAKQGDTVVDSCSFNINVKDCEAPDITCPSEPITKCNDTGVCTANVSFDVTATDICDANPTIVCTNQDGTVVKSGDSFPSGTTTVTCIATDASGNSSTCNFTITVNDCEKPVVTCPGDKNVTAGPCSATASVTFSVSVTDNCDGTADTIVCKD
ncbi:MAG TPA: HYR domain-containing protein, partial [Candidatus Limnocylindrales bacterium]|nr:HYR domain-containing protein [Candidatus Limnocylindrales bacterium]